MSEWLMGYKLGDYTPLFEGAGYDATDFLQGLTSDELVEVGVVKPGHKKKILTALSSLRHKEHLIMTKPVRPVRPVPSHVELTPSSLRTTCSRAFPHGWT